jgi:hypothetical protein
MVGITAGTSTLRPPREIVARCAPDTRKSDTDPDSAEMTEQY